MTRMIGRLPFRQETLATGKSVLLFLTFFFSCVNVVMSMRWTDDRYPLKGRCAFFFFCYTFFFSFIFPRNLKLCFDWPWLEAASFVIIGILLLSLLASCCCYYWHTIFVIIGIQLLSLLASYCCHYWHPVVVIIGILLLLLLAYYCCHYWQPVVVITGILLL